MAQSASSSLTSVCLLVALLWASPSIAAAQGRHEILRGRVTTDSGKAIPDATVIATMAPDRIIFRGTSDPTGHYQLDVQNGTGDYLLYIAAVGRTPFRKRVTSSGTDSVFVVDATLVSSVQQIATVTTKAVKLTPTRGADRDPTSPGDQMVDGVTGGLAGDDQGDLTALAAMTPGVLKTSDGFSVLGLPASQNAFTLNGMAFLGGDLPRDSRMTVRVSTTPFDPARGWSSGANVDARISSPGTYTFKQVRATMNAQNAGGAAGAGPSFAGSYSASGRLDLENHFFYNFAAQGSRQSSDATTLLDATPALLRDMGVAPDSVRRLLDVLTASGIPFGLPPRGARPLAQNGSALFQIERNPGIAGAAVPTTWALTGYAKVAQSDGLGFAPSATPSLAGSQSRTIGSLGGTYSHYFGPDYLLEAHSTVSTSRLDRTPYSALPQGRVAIESSLDDGTVGGANLNFAGGTLSQSRSDQSAWESSADLKFYVPGHVEHRLKLSADVKLDALSRESANDGQFTFESLSDLAANQPASFSRVVGSSTANAAVWNAFVAAGDIWRPTDALQLNYGVRLDGAAFTAAPDAHPDVDARFGTHSGTIPNSVHPSPRLGFIWRIDNAAPLTHSNDLGYFQSTPSSVLRGGIGEFRNITSASPLLDALVASRGGVLLTCVGSATPVPDWSAYAASDASIPTSCASGGLPAYADATRAVHLFDGDFAPSRSWRGNLSYSATPFGLHMWLDETYSYNLDQPSVVDRNIAAAPVFVVPGEGRAVYAPASSIVPASGIIAAAAGRADAAFGSVIEHRSDLRSTTNALTASLSPYQSGAYFTRLSYTLTTMQSETRPGDFGGTAFGPIDRPSWGTGSTPRHAFLAQFGVIGRGVTFSGVARLTSGSRFTPLVSGDVNGDGLVNDRAFVDDPAHPTDPTLSAPMLALLASAPKSARQCLEAQLGTPAGRNSCTGPWTSDLSATLSLVRPELRARRISRIDLSFVNMLSGVDALLHGSQLRGWGQSSSPDPVLYFVRGFDPSTQRFEYSVNPAFGDNRPSLARLVSPFRLTLDVSIDVGLSLGRQQFNSNVLPGRAGHTGKRQTFDEVRRRYANQVSDPFRIALLEADSLLLTRAQVESLKVLDAAYIKKIEPVWNELATYLTQLGDDFDDAEAYHRQEDALDRGWEIAWREVHWTMPDVLSPLQLSMLPSWAGRLYRMPTYVKESIRLVR